MAQSDLKTLWMILNWIPHPANTSRNSAAIDDQYLQDDENVNIADVFRMPAPVSGRRRLALLAIGS